MGPGKPVISEETNTPRIKILVVDDDDLNRRMMKVLLGREGYEVDLAANGLEALDAVKYQKYQLVFMDLQMPIIDGVETSRRIREWENGGAHTYIVALTASYLPEEGHVLYQAGIDNYISKPFEMEHIQRMLKYITDNHAEIPAAEHKTEVRNDPTDGVLDVQTGLKRVGGDEFTFKELLRGFMDELPARLNTLQQYFLQHDVSELGRAAHNLRGVAANLGALKLSEIAEKLDKQCNEGYTDSIQGLILEVQEMGSRLQEVARNFLAGAKLENLR